MLILHVKPQDLLSHFFIACRPIPLYFCQIVDLVTDCVANQWTSQRCPWGRFSNELRMGGMKAFFFLSRICQLGGILVWCGARLTCTLQKFICAIILAGREQGSFVLCQDFKVMQCRSFYLTCHLWLGDYPFGIYFQTFVCNWTTWLLT